MQLKQSRTIRIVLVLFGALTMSLAARIGVGSLSGIALGVYLGGPGTLLWIWTTSFLCATMAFAESVLAVVYRRKDEGHIYRGGPFYYISDGLGKKHLALIYAFVILFAYIGGFLSMQVNTVTKCFTSVMSINPLFIGLTIAIVAGLTIFGGVKKIAGVTSKLVPIITVFYLSICLYIIISNYKMVPQILVNIIDSAFNYKAFGFGILSTLLIGMQKGIFSSELGLGTGSIAAATTDTKTAAESGLVQTFGIHIENLLFATITTFAICMSDYASIVIGDPNGIELTLHAFKYHIGNIGPIFITITITLFALSTVLAGYYYGESSLKFIKKAKPIDIIILKILTLIVIIISSIISSNLLWTIVDIMVGVIAVINVYALFALRKTVVEEYKYYKSD